MVHPIDESDHQALVPENERDVDIEVNIRRFEQRYNERCRYEKYVKFGHICISIFMIALFVFFLTFYGLYENAKYSK
ncbi:unnamed protein product [Caenorhabditis angaria]|uniref:Uncharacterized protein n=1 Tax=Caenorhabditis angaria TaxID=860376 RepID=A0A9P1NBI0_9PELO|nr:unnamed protein product [Caenorhabditis angaria]